MQTNEKLIRLISRSKDKTLPRDVRRQAALDLEWEKFRIDKRPVMTFKSSRKYEMLSNISSMICFGWISLDEFFSFKGSQINSVVFPIILLFMIISILIQTRKTSKCKTEPADDLARYDILKASNIAFLTLFSVGLLLIFIMCLLSGFDENKGFSVSWYNLIFILCFVQSLHSLLKNIFFLIIEKDSTGCESEEE